MWWAATIPSGTVGGDLSNRALILILLGLVVSLVGSLLAFEARYANRIYPGVSIWGTDVGGLRPDGEAKRVYGVVVEVTMNQGLDIVAAYADHTARYFNYSGAAIVWENADNSLDEAIDRVLEAGGSIVHKIGPWEDVRPPAPPTGQVRVSLLTPSGLHFGQGPFNVLASDEMGGPIIAAAMRLMQALMERSKRASA